MEALSVNGKVLLIGVGHVVPDHIHQIILTGKSSAIIAFPFQNAPEPFHGPVINAMLLCVIPAFCSFAWNVRFVY